MRSPECPYELYFSATKIVQACFVVTGALSFPFAY